MRKFLLIGSLTLMSLVSPGHSQADDYYYYEWGFWWGPANGSDAAYWPAYRTDRDAPRDPQCVRWNWQELSYYDYCGQRGYGSHRQHKGVIRVRD
jgi:hypothetical protein